MAPHAHPNRRYVPWCLRIPNYETPCYTTQPVTRCHRRRERRSLPLTHDVVCLVGVHGSPVGDVGAGREIGAGVASGVGGGKTEQGKAEDGAEAIESDYEAAALVAVAEERGENCRDDGVEVG